MAWRPTELVPAPEGADELAAVAQGDHEFFCAHDPSSTNGRRRGGRRPRPARRGHGIGLATVSRLVRAHGGQAGIETTPEGGTEVWFELPDAGRDDPPDDPGTAGRDGWLPSGA